MSTRREVILSWLCEKRQTWRLCYLLGEAGSGKTWLAQQLQKDKHRRVITLSLVVSWQGKAAWIVTDDNAAEQGCRDSAWTRDEGNDSNLLIVFYVQIMPDDFVMQLHR
ncbi:hypothetical protein RNO93_22115, partial [Escherichia coli]|nr:hypothetical protein [Escherichia coli]